MQTLVLWYNLSEVVCLEYEVREFTFKSSNQINEIYGKMFIPIDIEVNGIVQICHGMCEYIDKYINFAKFLMNNGFIVCGHDQIGHGNSIISQDNLGYFAENNGYKFLIEDLKCVTDLVKKEFPDLPIFLFGHSMGSFVSRCYIAKYGKCINGAILCGTIGPQPLAYTGIKLANLMIDKKGGHYRSKMLYNVALDFANIKFLPVNTRFDWICSDEEEVSKHIADTKSNFLFTVSGFKDLFYLVNLCNSTKLIKTIPKDLPILFISGELDPIGENSKGVKKAVNLYKKSGIKDVKCKIYLGDRHELINEKNKEEIYSDVLEWINKNLK